MFTSKYWIYLMGLLLIACTDDVDPVGNPGGGLGNSSDWTVPVDQVFDGGVGKDGILALINPSMISASQATYLEDSDLVVGYKVDDDIRAYPHEILDWHEIINDDVGDQSIAITYCPLTGTAIGWSRILNGQNTTFGVSGLLYNTNLIPYDRLTDSNWSQMRLDCINGDLQGEEIPTYQVVETTWGTWKQMYPNSTVVSNALGLGRPYGEYPYIDQSGADYRVDPFLLFPIATDDQRLPRKERVHGIIVNGQAKVYQIDLFPSEMTLLEDQFQGEDLIVVGSSTKNIVNSFQRRLADGTSLDFEVIDDGTDAVLSDSEGNLWDIFGAAISGPRMGQKLQPTNSFIGFWFSWGTFYPNAEIHEF